MFTASLIGFACGFLGSIPVAGPIGILIFGRALEDRARSAVYLALGSALAESVYAYLAFWGFGELLASYKWIEPISRGLGAVLLTGLGLRLALKRNGSGEPQLRPNPKVGNKRSFLLGLTITALNPTLVATWGAAVTFIHSFDVITFDSREALPFSIGVCVGIVSWFVLLLLGLGRHRGRFPRTTLDRTIRVMGVLLTALGLFFAYRFVAYLRSGA